MSFMTAFTIFNRTVHISLSQPIAKLVMIILWTFTIEISFSDIWIVDRLFLIFSPLLLDIILPDTTLSQSQMMVGLLGMSNIELRKQKIKSLVAFNICPCENAGEGIQKYLGFMPKLKTRVWLLARIRLWLYFVAFNCWWYHLPYKLVTPIHQTRKSHTCWTGSILLNHVNAIFQMVLKLSGIEFWLLKLIVQRSYWITWMQCFRWY